MRDRIVLPTDPEKLAMLIDTHVNREEYALAWKQVLWKLCWEYVANGVRRFEKFDLRGRRISGSQLDANGNLEFRSEEMLVILNEVAGRIASADYRPVVSRDDTSLGAFQDRAVAQILVDWQIGTDSLKRALEPFSWILASLGSCGLCSYTEDDPALGLMTDLEVVHPKELMPFPSTGYNMAKIGGMVRQRWLSLERLVDKFGTRVKRMLDDMDMAEDMDVGRPIGDTGMAIGNFGTGSGLEYAAEYESATSGTIVKVRELWTCGAGNRVIRHVVQSGKRIIENRDFNSVEVPMPIGIARFYNNGTFHGAGVFEAEWGLVRMFELLLKQSFNNVALADRAGYILMPQGRINTRTIDKDIGTGLKWVFYERDAMSLPEDRPIHVPYPTTGDIPGRTAAFTKQLIGQQNPSRDILREKGRVESALGLSFLEEESQKAFSTVMQSAGNCFSTVYRSTVAQTVKAIMEKPRKIPVGVLSLDLAGAVIDPESRDIRFPENPVPVLWRLNMNIRDASPKSRAARMESARQAFMDQRADMMRYVLFLLKENLDPPFWIEDYRGAVEAEVWNILVLFGDGVTPGGIGMQDYTTKPEVQIVILDAFLASPRARVASPEVLGALREHRLTIQSYLGAVLPEGVPNPDDAAAQPAGGPPTQQQEYANVSG